MAPHLTQMIMRSNGNNTKDLPSTCRNKSHKDLAGVLWNPNPAYLVKIRKLRKDWGSRIDRV